jgi:hypothetical protein
MSDEGRFTAPESGWYRFETGREPVYLGPDLPPPDEDESPREVRRPHLNPPPPPWQLPAA